MQDNIMKKRSLKETASGGSTGAGGIAVVPGRLGFMQSRNSLKDFLVKWHSKVKNKFYMHPVNTVVPIKEFYDLNDVVSRLKGIESSDYKSSNTVTYGVEDDQGNIMKVSVRKDQSKDFEYKLARDMADAKDHKLQGSKANI